MDTGSLWTLQVLRAIFGTLALLEGYLRRARACMPATLASNAMHALQISFAAAVVKQSIT